MSWSDAVPNLLIGLREGLEAGLVVSILLAAVAKMNETGRRVSSTPIWLGLLGAVMVAGSFAAVLSYSTSVLSSAGQEAVGGVLSVVAVGLVTGMIFWMRKTAAGLSAHLRGDVARAVAIGAGALAVTSFLSVGREGLETTLFIWTAVKASGQTTAPVVGAALGLLAAIVLCVLLYHRAVRLNLGVFFNRTAVLLIIIAAGVLAYGLGDLQDAGWLPGQHWVAFDVSAHIDPTSWWASIITGVTEIAPTMTVLQVVAWAVYLAVVIPAFILAGRTTTTSATPAPAAPVATEAAPARGDRWERLAGRRPWTTAGVLVVVPAVAAGVTIAALPAAEAATTTAVTVTKSQCAKAWTGGRAGNQTFAVDNKSSKAAEVRLDDASGGIVAEIETLGPATTADLTATLSSGTYSFQCLLSGGKTLTSAPVSVSGSAGGPAPAAVAPVTVAQLTGPNDAYQAYAAKDLRTLATDVGTLRGDLARGDLPEARAAWLTAQLDWERVGASYDSFGDLGVAIDGLPDGLSGGVNDPRFTGLHRIEYGLWHGQSAAQLQGPAATLSADITKLQHQLGSDDVAGDPTNLPLRAHEILEDALRDHLSGIDDEGGGAAYPETLADVEVTRVVLGELGPLVEARAPSLPATVNGELDTLVTALGRTGSGSGWYSLTTVPTGVREQVDAALGNVLQSLDAVPNLLEVPPTP